MSLDTERTSELAGLIYSFRLETEFLEGCVKHTRYVPGYPDHDHRGRYEEVWDEGREAEDGDPMIGRGSFGVVRFQRRRQVSIGAIVRVPYQVRAVKEIRKPFVDDANGRIWMKELEAIAKFSQSRYEPYFARMYDWFENSRSVFISMEYFPMGDLRRFMGRCSFPEGSVIQIVRQLIHGIRFMHESKFAHRDLKPANILVASNFPRWSIRIADFGISKQAVDGGTQLATQNIGTPGYIAPEVLGFFSSTRRDSAYSVSVDIWAIGVIAMELLLNRQPFPTLADIAGYVSHSSGLNFGGVAGLLLSTGCVDFVSSLLTPNPIARPTASAAATDSWLAPRMTSSSGDRHSVRGQGRGPSSRGRFTGLSASSVAWSNSQRSNGLSPRQDTLLSTYAGPRLDRRYLLSQFRNLPLEETRYFVLRSDNALDIETSAAHNVWTSSSRVNKILDKGYRRSNGRVVLFFSIIGSRKFSGVVQMTSELDWDNTDEHWLEDTWQGRFTLTWLCYTELSFDKVKTVPVSPRTPGFRAIACYDGTEIAASSALELLTAFSAEERGLMIRPGTLRNTQRLSRGSMRVASLARTPLHVPRTSV